MPITPNPTKPKRETSIWHTDISALFFSTARAKKLPMKDLALICRKTAILLDAGTPLKTAVPILITQFPGAKAVLTDLNERITQGESFSGALNNTGAFPPLVHGLVMIGEATAKLPKVMEELADHYEGWAQVKSELLASLLYPVAVAVMMLAVIVLAVVMVLPGYAQIFAASGVSLPALTQFLINTSILLTGNVHIIMVSFSAMVLAGVCFFKSSGGRVRIHELILHIPLVKQSVNLHVAQAMSLLLSSGLSVSTAVPYCAEMTENHRVRKDLNEVDKLLRDGSAFWYAIGRIKYFDPILISLAQIGEESGNMSESMANCRSYLEKTYRHSIKRLNKLIEPVITITLGLVLGLVMLAIILPTFEMAMVV